MNREELRTTLNDAYSKVQAAIDGLADSDWETATGTEDHWTVRDTIGHLASGTKGNLQIAQAIVDGRELYRPDFDLARYNKRNIEKAAQMTGADQAAALSEAYAQALSMLDVLTDEQLAIPGRRTTGEDTTVAGVFERIAGHMDEHLSEIQAATGK